jgi:hypothetical protein
MKLKTYQLIVKNAQTNATTSEACETVLLFTNGFFVFSGMNREVIMPKLKMQLNKMCLLHKRLSY